MLTYAFIIFLPLKSIAMRKKIRKKLKVNRHGSFKSIIAIHVHPYIIGSSTLKEEIFHSFFGTLMVTHLFHMSLESFSFDSSYPTSYTSLVVYLPPRAGFLLHILFTPIFNTH